MMNKTFDSSAENVSPGNYPRDRHQNELTNASGSWKAHLKANWLPILLGSVTISFLLGYLFAQQQETKKREQWAEILLGQAKEWLTERGRRTAGSLEQGSGAKVITCESGQRALETIRSVHPDVVLSDILMPDMDGYEFLNELRALGAEGGGRAPVIALTAFASESDIVRIRQAGFQMHVPKPVEPAQLILAIAELIRTSNTET